MANYAIPMERRLIVVAGRAAMAKNIFEKLLSIHGRQALDTPCASEKPELMKIEIDVPMPRSSAFQMPQDRAAE
jgi:hypothetical protein